jgi:glycolate oxidase
MPRRARAETTFDAMMRLTISLGGTITSEHGVGRMKQPSRHEYLGPEVHGLNRRIKDALDPIGIVNRGAGIWRPAQ